MCNHANFGPSSQEQQATYFDAQTKKFDEDIITHIKLRDELEAAESGKGAATLKRIGEWNKKMVYLNHELRRYHDYADILAKRREKPSTIAIGAK